MTNEENHYQWMNAYANNELEGDKLRVFEDKLKNDPEFKEEVDLFIVLRADHNLKQKERFKALLSQEDFKKESTAIVEKNDKKKGAKVVSIDTPKTNSRTWLLRAASLFLLGLVGAILYFNLPSKTTSTIALSKEYLQTPYDGPIITRGETAIQQDWENAVEAYDNQNFEQALVHLQQILKTGKAEDQHYFYAALSALYQKNKEPQKAVNWLNKIKGGLYGEAVDWYKSLAYIQLEKYEEAKKLLEPIAKSGSKERQQKAIKLLNSI